MAGFDQAMLTPTLVTGPGASGPSTSPLAAGDVQPHHGLIGLVVLAAAILFLLDRAGFRFAVTAGKR